MPNLARSDGVVQSQAAAASGYLFQQSSTGSPLYVCPHAAMALRSSESGNMNVLLVIRTGSSTFSCITCAKGCLAASATSCCTRSEEHTSELKSLMSKSYAVFCLQKNTKNTKI